MAHSTHRLTNEEAQFNGKLKMVTEVEFSVHCFRFCRRRRSCAGETRDKDCFLDY